MPPELQLLVHQPNMPPAPVTLSGEQPITLGRASECTIPIKDRFLSRHHAEITFNAGQWIVRDCGSVNGTMLNGNKLLEPMSLRAGDKITLGDTEVIVQGEEMLLRSQIVPARHFRDRHPRRQALGHDPRLRLGAPPPPPQRPGDHLEPPNLTNLRVNPTVKT